MIEENRRLAERVETATADLARYRQIAMERNDVVRQAREETEARMRAEWTKIEEKHLANQRYLESQAADLERQVKEQGKVLLMPPNGWPSWWVDW